MYRRATKDNYEREQEEAERLVRPMPKLKPPRRDLRRERTDAEHVLDEDEEADKRASMASRVAYRHCSGKSKDERIPAWNKKEKRRVLVSPDTLKEQPDLYSPVEEGEQPDQNFEPASIPGPDGYGWVPNPKAPPPKEAPKPVETPKEAPKPAEPPKPEAPKEEADPAILKHVQESVAKMSPKERDMLKHVSQHYNLDEAPKEIQQVADTPWEQVPAHMRARLQTWGVAPPEGMSLRTYIQKLRAVPDEAFEGKASLTKPAEAPPKEEAKPPVAPPPAETPKLKEEAKPEAPKPEEPKPSKPEEAKPVAPEAPPAPPPEMVGDKPILQVASPKIVTMPEVLPLPPPPPPAAAAPAKSEAKPKEVPGVDNPAFKAFTEADPSVTETPAGPLFPNPGGKGKVPFHELPEKVQADWLDRFDEEQHTRLVHESVAIQGASNSASRQALQDLHNPNSALGQKVKALKGDFSTLDPVKAIPELKGHVPEGVDNLQDLLEASKKAFPPPPPPPKPAKEPTPEEIDESWQLAQDSLPPVMAARVAMSGMSPDEVKEVIAQYEAFVKKPLTPGAKKKFVADAQGNFVTDPMAVRPPETDDEGTPFEALEPDKQAEIMQAHRVKVYTKSLVAREMLTGTYKDAGIPLDIGYGIADFQLQAHPGEPEKDRVRRAAKAANEVFDRSMTSGKVAKVSESKIREALESCGADSAASKLVTAYFQANDFHAARDKFLSEGSEDAFSEHHTPGQIAAGVIKATSFLRKRSEQYPADAIQHDSSAAFRVRVMARLKTLDPEKYSLVRQELQMAEVEQYKEEYPKFVKDYKKWHTADAKFKAKSEKVEAKHQQALEKYKPKLEAWKAKCEKLYSDNANQPRGYRDNFPVLPSPPPEPKKEDIGPPPPEPQKPCEPVGFVKHTDNEADIEAVRERLWTPGKKKQASVSIYPRGSSMSHRSAVRTALYNGIEPAPVEPYVPWTQAQQRLIDDRDLDLILKEAKVWLRTPVLSKHFEGASRDTQLRAALDLSIRTALKGYYSAGFPPPVYETLLRRLAGVGEQGTLLTIAKSAYESESGEAKPVAKPVSLTREANMSTKLAAQHADQVLARLDKIAKVIQERHATWGMPFELAKAIVNDLDRTADEIEKASFGEESFLRRQAEVIQKDSDEPYMDTFRNPMQPRQTDADEPYMAAYKDDQSSAVDHGVSTSGRPLAP
jgi:hypothetical protein